MTRMMLCLFLAGFLSVTIASAADKPNTAKPNGNRLAYLDEPCNPWYPHRDFPKLTTPMWVGEEGVEAVVILGIDDMRGHEKWEAYLRPILNRLKQIDGRAPVSIFTCSIDPKQPHLQQWLEEGLSLEIHTIDHPCPLLGGTRGEGRGASGGKGNASSLAPQPSPLALAKSTVDRCIDLLNEVPNNKPVCFRMPCCDSLNTLSPRFYTEIFNKTTAKGNYLLADSSVMHVFTSADPELPRELVLEAAEERAGVRQPPDDSRKANNAENSKEVRGLTHPGSPNAALRERFKKYLPADRFFANSIENYPYPFVIDRLCWEFPCAVPSDWAAQHLHKPNNPKTIEDWKAALDCTVIKQGVFCLVFHPHNWIKPEQINELIDHAVTKHGKKVKFLNFREAVERLNKNVLGGQTLRDTKGNDNGVRLLDVNNDGFIDAVSGNSKQGRTAVWNPEKQQSSISDFPVDPRLPLVRFIPQGEHHFMNTSPKGVGAGVLDAKAREIWVWLDGHWRGPNPGGEVSWPFGHGIPDWDSRAASVVVRNFFGHGAAWLAINYRDEPQSRAEDNQRMRLARFTIQTGRSGAYPVGFPKHLTLHWGEPAYGWAFVDLDEDGIDDVICSNADEYLVALARNEPKPYINEKQPPALLYDVILQGQRGDKPAEQKLPPIVRADGSNNGFWVHARQLVWMNEDTAKSKDLVERRSFDGLLAQANHDPNRRAGERPPPARLSERRSSGVPAARP